MCRSTDFPNFRSGAGDRLKIRGFYVRFSDLIPGRTFPESLTLLYLPRISEHSLEIDGSKIRPDLPAFVTLHRVVSEDGGGVHSGSGASYGSRDRVCASEGLRFEVYAGEEKALKGVFRRDEYGEWAVDCKCGLEAAGCGGGEAEVCVSAEGHVALVERVEMVAARRKGGRRKRFHGGLLEEIPEEREEEESDGCCCCSCVEGESGSDGGDVSEYGSYCGADVEECTEEIEVNMEGVRWAVDVGIWVMCLGVGILVSTASARRLRRRRFI